VVPRKKMTRSFADLFVSNIYRWSDGPAGPDKEELSVEFCCGFCRGTGAYSIVLRSVISGLGIWYILTHSFQIHPSHQSIFADDPVGAVEVFIIGAALSTTSLGTTFVVINSAAKSFDFSQSKVGTVLISAAVFDDVSGLIMAR